MLPKDLRKAAAALQEAALFPPLFEESVPEMTERASQLVGLVKCPRNLKHCYPAIAQLLEDNEVRRLERMATTNGKPWHYQSIDGAFERRRLYILNALFWALERCGAVPHIDKRDGRTVRVMVGDTLVSCRLESPAVLSCRENVHLVPRNPAGPLRFVIVGWFGRPNSDEYWQDEGSHRDIETMLTDITIKILVSGEFRYRASLRDRHDQALRRREAALSAEEKQRQQEEQQRRVYLAKLAQDRVNDLLALARRWQQARDLRSFVQAVKAGGCDIVILPPPSSNQNWVRWALELADELDPLVTK
jgi:hypothetical protein